jgi:ribose-phosphate pyrophosphokinase
MDMILFSFTGNENLTQAVASKLQAEVGTYKLHTFPDGESLVTILSDVENKQVVIVCSLNKPDNKFIPLYFFSKTAKQLGAKEVILLAPYLSYMRQDKQFNKGEGITSHYFADLLSSFVDTLITIDPHLHRTASLSDIYKAPAYTLHAANKMMLWIKDNVKKPLLIGPDSESEQWVSKAGHEIDAPYIILEKNRKGDKDVEVSVPDVQQYYEHTPVLMDDIISTARTMIQTVNTINKLHMKPPICIGIHAVFAGDAYQELLNAGVEKVITCNTIPHISNGIDLSDVIVEVLKHKQKPVNTI